jgi:hypothetical protein
VLAKLRGAGMRSAWAWRDDLRRTSRACFGLEQNLALRTMTPICWSASNATMQLSGYRAGSRSKKDSRIEAAKARNATRRLPFALVGGSAKMAKRELIEPKPGDIDTCAVMTRAIHPRIRRCRTVVDPRPSEGSQARSAPRAGGSWRSQIGVKVVARRARRLQKVQVGTARGGIRDRNFHRPARMSPPHARAHNKIRRTFAMLVSLQ